MGKSKEKNGSTSEKPDEKPDEKSDEKPVEKPVEKTQDGGRIENLLTEINDGVKKQGTILDSIGEFISGVGGKKDNEKPDEKPDDKKPEAARGKSFLERVFSKKESDS